MDDEARLVDRVLRCFNHIAVEVKSHQIGSSQLMAVHDCRMINMWRTPTEPMKTVVAEMQAAEGKDGVLSVSFAHGFPWQDVPDTSAKMLVIADGDRGLAAATARRFGERLWSLRDETRQPLLTIGEALDAIEAGPVVRHGA